MSKTGWQDPLSKAVVSPDIAGLQEAVGRIEGLLNFNVTAESGVALTEVYISTDDRYRIFQCAEGKRCWVSSPAPVIKKNGATITTGFRLIQGGGAIVLDTNALGTDVFTADVTYINSTNTGSGSGLDADKIDGYSSTSLVKYSDVLMNTNPFGGKQLYINSMDNAMYAAANRWNVVATKHSVSYNSETYPKLNPAWVASYTVTGSGTSFTVTGSPASIIVYNGTTICTVSASPTTQYQYSYSSGVITLGATATGTIQAYPEYTIPQYLDSPIVSTYSSCTGLFDGSYEGGLIVETGYYMKIHINPTDDSKGGFEFTYPYGSYFLSYYYNGASNKAEYRVFNRNYQPHDIGWKKYDFGNFVNDNTSVSFIQSVYDGGNYGRTILEFIVYGHASHNTTITEVDWKLDRPALSTTGSTVTKYGINKLYYALKFGDKDNDKLILNPDGTIVSNVADGTAPFTVASTTKVDKLNVDYLEGRHGNAFAYSDTLADGTNFDTVIQTGMYRFGISNTNAPAGVDYGHLIVAHGGGDTITQIATDYNSTLIYWRSGNPTNTGGTGSWKAWRKIWHDGNDGTGSGLDADMVDGIESTRIIYGDNDRATRAWTTGADNITKTGFYYVSTNQTNLPVAANGMLQHIACDSADTIGVQIFVQSGTANPYIRYKNTTWSSWFKLWTAANDGTGSGLDADTLDGKELAAILNSDGNYVITDNRGADTPTDMGSAGVRFELKTNTTDGLNDGGTYHAIVTFQQWNDASGGTTHQLGMSDNNNLYIRSAPIAGTWGAWQKLWGAANDGTGSGLDADKLDGVELSEIVYGINGTGTTYWTTGPDNIVKSGFYYVDTVLTNLPTASGGHVIHISYSGDTTYAMQLYSPTATVNTYIRYKSAGAWGAWTKLWNASNDGSGSGLDADTLDSIDSSGFTRRYTITGCQSTSYRRTVIALCDLTNTDTGANSYSQGTFTFKRSNGLYVCESIYVNADKRYNSTTMNFNSLAFRMSGAVIRPCTFTYGGVKYGGLEIFIAAAESSIINFMGITNFNIFGVDYYDTNTSTVLNTEINNSLSFSGDIILENEMFYNDYKVWNALNDGAGSGLDADKIDGLEASDLRLKQSQYQTTTAAAEGYYRVATIDMTKQFKNAMFKVKAYTATGTATESTIIVNLSYYSGNYGSQYSSILANTSHSYNSQTNAENGWVLLYCRVSFDGTYGYIDLYKYKATAVTMEIEPLLESDWVWATGALTVNPAAGSYRNFTCTLGVGTYGNNLYAQSAGSATYSNYGVLFGETIHNTTDKTGQWEYIGNIYIGYYASYLEGHSCNVTMRLQEMSYDGSIAPADLDDFDLHIRANLATHTDSTTFNTLVPTFYVEVSGQCSLDPTTDVAMLVYSTSTSSKTIRIYVKLKSANTVYSISPRERYGRSFNATTSLTTSYCYLNGAAGQAAIAALPAPAQGSVVYGVKRTVDADAGVKSGGCVMVYNPTTKSMDFNFS